MPDKFIREIEEILERAEHSRPGDDLKASKKMGGRPGRSFDPTGRVSRLRRLVRVPSSGKVMLAGIGLILIAVLLNAFVPGRVSLAMWAGLILFVVAYGLFFVRPGPQYERRWRGRLVDEEQVSLFGRIRRWLRG